MNDALRTLWSILAFFVLFVGLLMVNAAIDMAQSAQAERETPTIDGVTSLRLSDADTAQINFRLQGIDAPESRQQCKDAAGACYACGEAATAAMARLMGLHKDARGYRHTAPLQVRIWGVGKYGRVIATFSKDGLDLNRELVREGWALAYRRYLPDELKASYIAAEEEAQEAQSGMWAGEFVMPADWRRGERLENCE